MRLGSRISAITTYTVRAINALTESERRPERKKQLRADQTHCYRCLTADMCSLRPQLKKLGYSKSWSGDVDECFDETKTGVPVEKIERIILCHNSKLSSAEEEALTAKCQERGCLLDILGLGSLSFGLLEKHQILAKEYLEIELDTGQILSPADFVKRYQKSAFATPLDLKFHFREAERKAALDELETNDLLIIAGPPGVGKSRLALECMNKFVAQHPVLWHIQ